MSLLRGINFSRSTALPVALSCTVLVLSRGRDGRWCIDGCTEDPIAEFGVAVSQIGAGWSIVRPLKALRLALSALVDEAESQVESSVLLGMEH